MANMPTAQLVRRCLCMGASATFHWMRLSHLQLRILMTMSGWNRLMIQTHGVKIQETSQNKNTLPKVQMNASMKHYQTTALPWSYPKLCSWSLCWVWAKCCCWWWCGFAMRTWSDCESSHCSLFSQQEQYKQLNSCKWDIVRMEFTGWTVVQGLALWVGILQAL